MRAGSPTSVFKLASSSAPIAVSGALASRTSWFSSAYAVGAVRRWCGAQPPLPAVPRSTGAGAPFCAPIDRDAASPTVAPPHMLFPSSPPSSMATTAAVAAASVTAARGVVDYIARPTTDDQARIDRLLAVPRRPAVRKSPTPAASARTFRDFLAVARRLRAMRPDGDGVLYPNKPPAAQLAEPWSQRAAQFPRSQDFMVSLKLDGVRAMVKREALAARSGAGKGDAALRVRRGRRVQLSFRFGEVVAYSRNGTQFQSVSRIADALKPLFKREPTLVLDGELYCHDMDFNDLSGAVRSAAVDDRTKKLQSRLQFFAFDIVSWARINVTGSSYARRRLLLHRLLSAGVAPEKLHAATPLPLRNDVEATYSAAPDGNADADAADGDDDVDDGSAADAAGNAAPVSPAVDSPAARAARFASFDKLISNFHAAVASQRPVAFLDSACMKARDMDECLARCRAQDLEGVMIRHIGGAYTHARNQALMKHKEMEDKEFKCVGVVEGEGKLKGKAGAFIFRVRDDDATQVFRASFSGTDELKGRLWAARRQLVGMYATVQYQELSSKGVPRFPIVKAFRGRRAKDFV